MFEFFRSVGPIAVPIFVVSTMLNVGLTQKLSDILGHLKEWPGVVRMLIANFVLVPLVMILILSFRSFDPALEAGLLIFSLCAGAPFLIKLTQTTGHDLAFAAAAFGIGYFTGRGADHLQDVGGLDTAQRNTAAGLIIATQNFDDPNVLVMLTLANTLGIVMLLLIAKALSSDHKASTTPV